MARPRRPAKPINLRLSPAVSLALKLRAAREDRTLCSVADEILGRALEVASNG